MQNRYFTPTWVETCNLHGNNSLIPVSSISHIEIVEDDETTEATTLIVLKDGTHIKSYLGFSSWLEILNTGHESL